LLLLLLLLLVVALVTAFFVEVFVVFLCEVPVSAFMERVV
jgi:hypothetical protein